MHLVSYYTQSHEKLLFNYLISSNISGFTPVLFKGYQKCESAYYYKEGWFETVYDKVNTIIEYLDFAQDESFFVFSDPDVVFLKDSYERLYNLIKDYDILFQDDCEGGYCTGFFIARNTNNLKDFLRSVQNGIVKANVGDQRSANMVLDKYKSVNVKLYESLKDKIHPENFDLKHGFLPLLEFSSYRSYQTKTGSWEPGTSFQIKDIPYVFHANWTESVDNKYKLLDYIKDITCKY